MEAGIIRVLIRGMYEIQGSRVRFGNRLAANFRAKLGQAPGTAEEKMTDDEATSLLKLMRASHRRITEAVVGNILTEHKTKRRRKNCPTCNRDVDDLAMAAVNAKTFKGDELISDYTEYCLVSQFVALLNSEEVHLKLLKIELKAYPLWVEFLEPFKGIGEAMAGVIISEFDIHKAKYASSLWKYAGLDVAPDGAGRSRRKEHQVDVEYKNKDGETKTRKSITFNPFLKTKMVGVLGSGLLKMVEWVPVSDEVWDATPEFRREIKKKDGEEIKRAILRESAFRQVYRDYKNRMANHVKYGTHNDGKIDPAAKERDPNTKAIITCPARRHRA